MWCENEIHFKYIRDYLGSAYSFGTNDGKLRVRRRITPATNATTNHVWGDHRIAVVTFKVIAMCTRIEI